MDSFALILIVSLVTIVTGWSKPPRYVARELRFPEADSVRVMGLNDRGDVVGVVSEGDVRRGFVATDKRIVYMDRFFPGTNTGVVSINNLGQVIGYAENANRPDGVGWFIWSNNVVQPISTLNGYTILDVANINDRSEFVGHCSDGKSIFTFIFTGGRLSVLTQLPGLNRGHPWLRLNNRGQVVSYDDYGGSVVTTNSVTSFFENNTLDINDQGDVVGVAPFDCCEIGFLYSGGNRTAIFGLPGHSYTVPTAINGRRQVVGYAVGDDTSDSGLIAFRFEDRVTYDLNEITLNRNGFVLINPAGINKKGVVVCLGLRNGRYSAFLLKPVGTHRNSPRPNAHNSPFHGSR